MAPDPGSDPGVEVDKREEGEERGGGPPPSQAAQ